jgi:hypothetical protein
MVHVGADDTYPPGTHDVFQFNIGEEYWIGYSVYFPIDFVADVEGNGDLVFQIQAAPDPGESYRSPVLVIQIDEDRWRVVSRWDTRDPSPPGNNFEGSEDVYEEFFVSDLGKWTDWVFHVKWSWQSDGLIEIWKNGILVGDRIGPNCSNDASGPYPSLGIYKWCWQNDPPSPYCGITKTDFRLVYHDEFRIGGADSSYEDVVPGGDQLPTPTPTPTPTTLPGTPTPTPTSPPSIPGDLDGDGDVDIFDLILVGSHFGEDVGIPCTLDPCPDTDGDGDVDIFDLITVGSHFGEGG